MILYELCSFTSYAMYVHHMHKSFIQFEKLKHFLFFFFHNLFVCLLSLSISFIPYILKHPFETYPKYTIQYVTAYNTLNKISRFALLLSIPSISLIHFISSTI